MKKSISLLLVTALTLALLTACGGKLKVDENTVYVNRKGKVTGATVESFDKAYYNEKELETYINRQVEAYTAEHDRKSVRIDSFSVADGIARLNIAYAGYEDYAAFNEVEMFVGTIPQAMAAGYDFKDDFLAVENGELAGEADRDTVIDNGELKVVILNEKVNVKVQGTVRYVSAGYTTPTAKDTVTIKLPEDALDGEELALVYIIYK